MKSQTTNAHEIGNTCYVYQIALNVLNTLQCDKMKNRQCHIGRTVFKIRSENH